MICLVVDDGEVSDSAELPDESVFPLCCQCAITVNYAMVVEVVGLSWDGGGGVFAFGDDVVRVDAGVLVDAEAWTVSWNLSRGEAGVFTWTEMIRHLVMGLPCLSVLCFLSDSTNGPGGKMLVVLPSRSVCTGPGKKSLTLGKWCSIPASRKSCVSAGSMSVIS